MGNLFKKAAIYSDLHLGLKSNSLSHLEDCLEFTKWFIEQARLENCDICLFLGDFFHNRNSINLMTLSYGLKCFRLLSAAFSRVLVIAGNHDIFYKDSRSISSVEWAQHIPNIEYINEYTKIDDVIFVPWLVKDEHKKIQKSSATYLMGHLELPRFLMNAQIEMPDITELKDDHFNGIGHVFTGHFHKRQTRNNITYIGNAFPHNFGDVWDDERGMMILPWGEDPKFISWPKAPKYRTVKISDLLVSPDYYLPEKGYIKLILDTNINFEEASYLKENLIKEYNLREMSLISNKKDSFADDLANNSNISFQTVDQIVHSQLTDIVSEFYDSNMLLEIYRGL